MSRFRFRLDPGAGYILATVLLLATFVACEFAASRNVVMDAPITPLPTCPECLCPAPACPEPPVPDRPDGPLDLNTASVGELQKLSGVGPSTAQRIVDYRARRPFRRKRDLLRVRGIGPRTFRSVAPHVQVTTNRKSPVSP